MARLSPDSSTTGNVRRANLASLTALRAVAAAAVFGRHVADRFSGTSLSPLTDRVLVQGANGVSFFFVLSGFVLAWSASRDRPGVARWAGRRAARVLPLHVLTWAAAFAVIAYEGGRVAAGPAAANLFLVQSFVPDPRVYYSMNAVAWSLSCELLFYVLFWPVLRVLLLAPRHAPVVAAGAALMGTMGTLIVVAMVGPSNGAWWGYIDPFFRACEFVLGMSLALLLVEGVLPRIPLWIAIAVTAGSYLAAGWATFPFIATGVTLLPFALLIVAAAQSDLGAGASDPPTTRSWMVTLGKWSFAFYLIHQLVIRVADRMRFGIGDGSVAAVVTTAVLLGASLALAAIAFTAVERPAVRWVRHHQEEVAR